MGICYLLGSPDKIQYYTPRLAKCANDNCKTTPAEFGLKSVR